MTGATGAGALSSTFTLDPASLRIAFVARHVVGPKVRGHFAIVEGSGHWDADDASRSRAEITIDAASLQTGNKQRDAHLRAKFLDTRNYPTITFKATRVKQATAGRYAAARRPRHPGRHRTHHRGRAVDRHRSQVRHWCRSRSVRIDGRGQPQDTGRPLELPVGRDRGRPGEVPCRGHWHTVTAPGRVMTSKKDTRREPALPLTTACDPRCGAAAVVSASRGRPAAPPCGGIPGWKRANRILARYRSP